MLDADLTSLGTPLGWAWCRSPGSAISKFMLALVNPARRRLEVSRVSCGFVARPGADEGVVSKTPRQILWTREEREAVAAMHQDRLHLYFDQAVVVTTRAQLPAEWSLDNIPQVPFLRMEQTLRDSRFIATVPLSVRGLRLSSKGLAATGLVEGQALYAEPFEMGGYRALLISHRQTPTAIALAGIGADGAGLRISLEAFGAASHSALSFMLIALPGFGFAAVPAAHAASSKGVGTSTPPSLEGFEVIGARSRLVVNFRGSLRCVDIGGAVLGAAGFAQGDVLAVERLAGCAGVVIRRDPAGKQRVRLAGKDVSFRLGEQVLSWIEAGREVTTIACKNAVVVCDARHRLDVPTLTGGAQLLIPQRVYPRPDGRLQLAGWWLSENGFDIGARYRIRRASRGIYVEAHPDGEYTVISSHAGGKGTPKLYIAEDYVRMLKGPTLGVFGAGPGRLMLTARHGSLGAEAAISSVGNVQVRQIA